MSLEFEITELNRRVSNLIRLGTIEQADYDAALVRVKIGDILSGWLPWLTHRAGNDISWHAPEIGEQVMVLSPSGELNQGVVLKGLYQNNALPPVNDPNKSHVTFDDGAVIEYDRNAHHLKAILPGGGTTELVSTGGVTIVGNVSVIGNITSSANIHAAINVSDGVRNMGSDRQIYNSHHHVKTNTSITNIPTEQQ